LKNAARYIKPNGRFVVIDYGASSSRHRDQPNLIVSEEQVTGWMKAAGFAKVQKVDLFPDKYFLVFSRAQTTQDRSSDHNHPALSRLGNPRLAVKPFPTLPKGILFLRLETFSTRRRRSRLRPQPARWLNGPAKSGCSRWHQKGDVLGVGHSSRRLDPF